MIKFAQYFKQLICHIKILSYFCMQNYKLFVKSQINIEK